MADCPFPVIPRYLGQQSFPAAMLPGAKVTHIWTQDQVVSAHIARASLIPNVVTSLEAMLGEVDGILLARDDAENHFRFAQVFVRAGIPIYIDKPLALNRRAAHQLLDMTCYPGQVFSCSALRYASELRMTPAQSARVGAPRLVDAVVPKDWQKYAVHVIEPVLFQFCGADAIEGIHRTCAGGVTQLLVSWRSTLQTRFTSTGTARAPIEISVHGSEGSVRMRFRRAFPAFKAALAAFVSSVNEHRPAIPEQDMLRVVDLVETGCG